VKKLFFGLLLFPIVAFATAYICYFNVKTYYVSPAGSDANMPLCAWAAPCLTIATVEAEMNPGDTLYLRGGTYSQLPVLINSGTYLAPITITAFSAELPVIDGASSVMTTNYQAVVDIEGSYVNLSNITIQNGNLTNPNGYPTYHAGIGIFVDSTAGAHNVTGVVINNVTVHDMFSGGIVVQGDNTLVENSVVYRVNLDNCRFTTLAACEPTVTYTSSGCYNAGSLTPGSITTNQAGFPIGTTGHGCNAGNILWAGSISIGNDGNPGWIVQNSTIRNCLSYDNWGEGIIAYTTNGSSFVGNNAYNNYSENIYVSNGTSVLISGNFAYNTPTATAVAYSSNESYWGSDTPQYEAWPGFTIDDECTDAPNYNCSSAAYILSQNETVIDNLAYNSPVCIFCFTLVTLPNSTHPGAVHGAALSGLNSSLVANNTIVSTVDIPNMQLQLGAAHVYAFATGNQALSPPVWNCNSWLKNNIIIVPGVSTYNYATYGAMVLANTSLNTNASCPSQVTLTYDYQYWHLTSAYVPAFAQGAHDVYQNVGSPITAVPSTITAGAFPTSYFNLSSGSLAANAGTAISAASSPSGTGVIYNYSGNPVASPPNMGAF